MSIQEQAAALVAAVDPAAVAAVIAEFPEAEKVGIAHALVAIDLRRAGGDVLAKAVDGNSSTVGDADDGNIDAPVTAKQRQGCHDD